MGTRPSRSAFRATSNEPDFEFQIAGPAISARARNRSILRAWTADVAGAARAAWPVGTPPMAGDLAVWITEFSEAQKSDRDNMAKPILDAMQGIAYLNDRQIKGLHVAWCSIDDSYIVRYMSPVVARAMILGREFLWIRVATYAARRSIRHDATG